jgi:mRNA-degrading endonuclease RelE of RelBE toxin-antitoxin system
MDVGTRRSTVNPSRTVRSGRSASGEFRLSVTFREDERRLVVARIKPRDGAYTADDD